MELKPQAKTKIAYGEELLVGGSVRSIDGLVGLIKNSIAGQGQDHETGWSSSQLFVFLS